VDPMGNNRPLFLGSYPPPPLRLWFGGGFSVTHSDVDIPKASATNVTNWLEAAPGRLAAEK
jgi:hypothetical protein